MVVNLFSRGEQCAVVRLWVVALWCSDVRWPELALLLPMLVQGRQLGARWIRAATCLVYFIVVLPCLVPGMLACMMTVGLLGRERGLRYGLC